MSEERATAFQIRMMSIRNNLLLWLLTGLVVAGLIAGIATFMKSEEEVGEMFDYQLQHIAYSMKYSARSVESQLKRMGTDNNEDNDFMVQIWDTNGKLLFSSLPSVPMHAASKIGFSDVELSGDKWRIFSLVSEGRIIQAAQPASSRAEASLDMAMRMLLPLAILIPALALLAWFAVKKSLKPLTNVTSEVEQRDAATMAPLDINSVPEEIRPLLIALNSLLGRLESSIASPRRFVADAAHELRTPLTALALQVDLVEQADNPEERNEAIEKLRAGIKRSSHLVSQLLALARQEPEVQRSLKRIDLGALVKQVTDDFSALAKFINISIRVEVEQPLMIDGDEEGLKAVVGNLVDNAIRYMTDGGEVWVSLETRNRNAILKVMDTGPGIPEEDRERIFERFYRIPGKDVTGSGLGLSIVKQIVLRHGAYIQVTRGNEGKGATFIIAFDLPRYGENT
jgi:two-component system, OmpR family, sensor kinase